MPRLSAGQRHESTQAVPLLEETLDRLWTDAVAGDKAYGTSDIRTWLTEREVEASDGEVRRIGPGTIMLADDTTGKGHITRGVGTQDRLSIFIPLAD